MAPVAGTVCGLAKVDHEPPIEVASSRPLQPTKKASGNCFPATWNCTNRLCAIARLLLNAIEFPGARRRHRLRIILVGGIDPWPCDIGGFFQDACTRPGDRHVATRNHGDIQDRWGYWVAAGAESPQGVR